MDEDLYHVVFECSVRASSEEEAIEEAKRIGMWAEIRVTKLED